MKKILSYLKNTKKKKGFSLIELSVVVLIIGIIVAAIIGGKKLINQSNLSKARALTNASPVNGIENLAFWVESTTKNSFGTVLGNGDTVNKWYDINPQSTSKNNLVVTSMWGLPTYKENGINGLPVVYYNRAGGTSACLGSENEVKSNLFSTDSGEITVFVVAWDQNPDASVLVAHSVWPSGHRLAVVESVLGKIRFDNGDDGNGNQILQGNGLVKAPFIFSAVQSSTGKQIFLNGALDSNNGATVLTPYSSKIYLGCWNDFVGDDYAMTGGLGEVIIFSRALSDFERVQVEQYLSKKWGVRLS